LRYSLKRLQAVDYDLEIASHPEVRCTFRDAGYIRGSAIAEVWGIRRSASWCSRLTWRKRRGRWCAIRHR
jgi:hypothetical protein